MSCEPNKCSRERDEGRESLSQFVVAGGDPAKLLDPAEETLDEVAIFVEVLVERPLNQAGAPGRNHRFDL